MSLLMAGRAVIKQIVPFFSDLLTWHKTITDITFAEQIENLPGKFLPRVASFNLTNDKITLNSQISIPVNAYFEITFGVIVNNYISGGAVVVGDNSSSSNYIYLLQSLGVKIAHITGNDNFANIQLDEGVFQEIKISGNGTTVTVENITKGLSETKTPNFTHILIDRISGRLGESLLFDGQIMYINLPDNNYILTGQGSYEYDLSGNGNHGTWSGTGPRFTYDLNGSYYSNVNGYSLWEHATLDPIQVPFDIDGNALSLTPGTDIPTGYTKTRDLLPGGAKWNMADSKVDFDPDSLGSAAVAIFDRSNATRQTAVSRASDYYNVATPYQYHVNEIADPRIYDTFFEAAYKDFVFGKVVLDGPDLIRYDGQLNYDTVKTGSDLVTVEEYCRIESIYP